MTAQIRLYVELAAGAILALAFGLYTWHERSVGAEKVNTADAKAQQAARHQAEAETQLNSERATKAEEAVAYAHQAIDQYRSDHPEQPVRVCHADNRIRVQIPGGATDPGAAAASTGPLTVSQVPDGAPGPDIHEGLDAIVSVAEELAIRYADLQQRHTAELNR